jgi:drug/metabolite transporter (DMT)-like permease
VTNNLRGIFYMLLSAASVSFLLSFAKLSGQNLKSNQVVFCYKAIMFLIILPWIFSKGIKILHSKKVHLYLLSSFFSTIASICLIHSLKYIELANVTCLGLLEKVLLSLIGLFYFKERYSHIKILAITLSFLAASIIIDPNFSKFDSNYLYVFASIILWVIHCVIVKIIGKTDSDRTQAFYNILFTLFISAVPTLILWKFESFNGLTFPIPQTFQGFSTPDINILWLFFMAVLSLIRMIASFKALQNCDLSVVMPFGYAKIIFSSLIGFFLFSEAPSDRAYIGFIILTLCAYLLLNEENKRRNNHSNLLT